MSSYINRRALPQSQRREIIQRQDYKCAICRLALQAGHYEFDHIQALEHDGDNSPDNWRALCFECHKQKTRLDHQARAKRDRIEVGGRQSKSTPMAGSRKSPWKRKMDGTVIRR